MLIIARPLDAGTFAKLGVTQTRVVATFAPRALAPSIEGAFGVAPFDQRHAVLVTQTHALGKVEEGIEIGTRFTWWVYRLWTDVDRPVDVGEAAGLLAPYGRGKHDIGELC